MIAQVCMCYWPKLIGLLVLTLEPYVDRHDAKSSNLQPLLLISFSYSIWTQLHTGDDEAEPVKLPFLRHMCQETVVYPASS